MPKPHPAEPSPASGVSVVPAGRDRTPPRSPLRDAGIADREPHPGNPSSIPEPHGSCIPQIAVSDCAFCAFCAFFLRVCGPRWHACVREMPYCRELRIRRAVQPGGSGPAPAARCLSDLRSNNRVRSKLLRVMCCFCFERGPHRSGKAGASGWAQSRGPGQAGREAAPTCRRQKGLAIV
jgi:hypothetical protein